jgi:hypothetical protein
MPIMNSARALASVGVRARFNIAHRAFFVAAFADIAEPIELNRSCLQAADLFGTLIGGRRGGFNSWWVRMAGGNEVEGSGWIMAGKRLAVWIQVRRTYPMVCGNLSRSSGLFAAKRGDGVMYVGAAIQRSGGLRAELARARLEDQTGNTS